MSIRCPNCRTRVVQKSMDGQVRIRTQVVVFGAEGEARAICKSCKTEVPLDLVMGDQMRKSLDSPQPGPRLLVRKAVDSAESGT